MSLNPGGPPEDPEEQHKKDVLAITFVMLALYFLLLVLYPYWEQAAR